MLWLTTATTTQLEVELPTEWNSLHENFKMTVAEMLCSLFLEYVEARFSSFTVSATISIDFEKIAKNSTTLLTLVHYQPAWPPKGVLYIALQKSWDRCESIWPICFYLLILFFTPIAGGSLHKSLCQIGLLFNTFILDIGISINNQ